MAELTINTADIAAALKKNLDADAQTQLIEDYINSVGSK